LVSVLFNDLKQGIETLDDFGEALDRFDERAMFELWLCVEDGPRMCMLRNGEHAFLMYLRQSEDEGFISSGTALCSDTVEYQLGNGQIDEHPVSWRIDLEQCYKALAYFFVNEELRPEWISWREG
jgi:hypothetical protein